MFNNITFSDFPNILGAILKCLKTHLRYTKITIEKEIKNIGILINRTPV